jgi:hypothetical protein
VLTVRQPWAWAIIHGGKDVENRVRNIAGAYRGPVAIHAAQTVATDALTDPNIIGAIALTRLFKGAGHPSTFKVSPRGAIIGVAQLVDVHAPHPETRCGGVETRWSMPDHWHLVFDHARALVEPIPFRGALGLRTLDDDTTARVQAALGPTGETNA